MMTYGLDNIKSPLLPFRLLSSLLSDELTFPGWDGCLSPLLLQLGALLQRLLLRLVCSFLGQHLSLPLGYFVSKRVYAGDLKHKTFTEQIFFFASQSDLLQEVFSGELAEKLSILFLLNFFSCFLLKYSSKKYF